MSREKPTAVICGIGRFGAGKLAELLVKSDIRVIGVGDYANSLNSLNNFELRGDVADVLEKPDYVFDFEVDENAWILAENSDARLAIIGVNRSVTVTDAISRINTNWRVLNFHGVYGAGMDEIKEGNVEEVGFLMEAVKLAVANNNLILPSRESVLRLLAEVDLTEAVMRGTFLSGTEREIFEIWGKRVSSEDVAKLLIDEAKMTRFKVIEGGVVGNVPSDEEVEEAWNKLRWRPETELVDSMKEVLQEAFSKADEEKRKGKLARNEKLEAGVEKQTVVKMVEEVVVKPEKRFEVEVEEYKEEEPEVNIPKVEEAAEVEAVPEVEEVIEVKVEKRDDKEELKKIMLEEYKDVPEKEVEIEEVETEIRPILVKNSNARLVNSYVEEKMEILPVMDEVKAEKVVEEKPKVADVKTPKKPSWLAQVNWLKWGWRVLLMAWAGAGVMLIVFGYTNYRIYKNLTELKKLINNKEYSQADTLVSKTLVMVRREENGVTEWGVNQWVWGRRYQEVLKVAERGLEIGRKAILIGKRADLINDGVFKDKDVDWSKELSSLKVDASSLSDDLGMLSGRLAGDWKWVPDRWKGTLTEAKSQLTKINKTVSLGERAIDVLPEVLGTDGKRREYLVLFQNESELRPGGGFIGSYGILSFEGGSLKNFEIKDIYEADGQLKGHVEPPAAIKNYLGEAKWYMRDANWQPSFGASSRDLQWFLEKETGRKVDGVIGIDLAVAKGVLGVVGEVYIPDFKEKINSSNLYEQAEFYSETNSFPGSVQKASFLGGLGKQLFEEIKNLKGSKRWELLQAMINLAEKNELQISLNNKPAAQVMAELGWSGEMYSGRCSTKDCFADYLYILEANLGVNKANYFLYRNVDQVVDIGENTISRVVKISYENTAKSSSWPGGDYKNYLRVYIPVSSNLAEVSVTDTSQGGIKTIYSGDSLSVNTVGGRKEVGFLVVVPVGSKRVVELRYLDQVALTGKAKFMYTHYVQKQSGFGDTGLVALVSIPNGWGANQVEPEATMVNGKLLFNQKLDRDIKMGVEISR